MATTKRPLTDDEIALRALRRVRRTLTKLDAAGATPGDYRELLGRGICGALTKHGLPFWERSELDLDRAMAAWPHGTGHPAYPVPPARRDRHELSAVQSAAQAYVTARHPWSAAPASYGANRRALLDWLIARYAARVAAERTRAKGFATTARPES